MTYLVSWNNVFTFWDMVQRLLLRNGLPSDPGSVARCRTAVDAAYRYLPAVHTWRFYNRRLALTTEAPITIDAVTYDHTGGTYERQLTITGSSTWPATAIYGEVLLGDVTYQIERRVSDTVVTLTEETNPGADTTSTAVTWYRSVYPFPVPVRQVGEVWRGNQMFRVRVCSPAEYPRMRKMFRQPGTPMQYSVIPSRDRIGVMDFCLIPPPTISEVYEIQVDVNPTPLRTYEIAGSDAAMTSGSTTVTCAGASFNSNITGSVFRLSPSDALPMGLHQAVEGRVEYEWQSVIRRVVSATQLELVEAAPSTVSDRGYSISDVLDINPAVMLDYFDALAFERFTYNVDHEKLSDAKAITREALRAAAGAESTTNYDHEPLMSGILGMNDKWWRYTTVVPPT